MTTQLIDSIGVVEATGGCVRSEGSKRLSDNGELEVRSVKKAKSGGELNDGIRKVAEIVLVLATMGKIRGGEAPSLVEMGNARAKLVEVSEQFAPKDVFPTHAFGSIIEDLGLDSSRGHKLGFQPPKISIGQKVDLTKQKMENSEKYAPQSSKFMSETAESNICSSVESHSGVWTFSAEKPSPVSSSLGFQPSGPVSTAISASLPYQLPSSEVRPPVSSGLPSSDIGKHTSALAFPRAERPYFSLNAKSSGISYTSQVQANSSGDSTKTPTWTVQSQASSSAKTLPDNNASFNASARGGAPGMSKMTSQAYICRPFITQTTSVNPLGVHQHIQQGIRFVQSPSPGNSHDEIGKIVQKFQDLLKESGTQDFSNIAVYCFTVDKRKIVTQEQLVEKALDITFLDDEVTKICQEVSECLDDVAEPVDVVEKGGDVVSVDVDEKGGGLDKNTLELTTTPPRLEPKMYVRPDFNVRCQPVIDILYAKVFTDADASLNVYGDIRILDSEGSKNKNFVFYEHGRFDSPQHIYSSSSMNNFLQLGNPPEIPTFNEPHLVVDIKNADTGAFVARGQKPLPTTTDHPSTPNDFEKLFTLQFEGDAQGGGLVETGARVELQCVAFTFGVYAQVEMFLYKDDDASKSQKKIIEDDDDGGELGVEVFGLISAKCHPLLLAKECYENHLFNVIREEHEWVGLGTEIDLFKHIVAVPAYSQLEISLDLRGYEEDDGFNVQGTTSFHPGNQGGGYKDVRGTNGFYVRVYVTRFEPSNLNKRWCEEDRIAMWCKMPHWPGLDASHLLEVFSLFIARPNGEEVNLYGSVKVLDHRGWCNVFSCSKNKPYFLSRGCNLLPLQGPDRGLQPLMSFTMEIDLHDVDGHVNIKGFVKSCVAIDERQRPWFDRRFCAVAGLVNEKSFAAVNYTLFSFAVQANMKVAVQFKGRSSAHVKIYGDIIASYDKLSYSTNYDAEFFRRVLFTRKKANFLEVVVEDDFQHSRYPLSKHVVAVPMKCSLLTKVNLSFQTNSGTYRVGGLVKFKIGEPCKIIKSAFVDICFDVDWRGLGSYV